MYRFSLCHARLGVYGIALAVASALAACSNNTVGTPPPVNTGTAVSATPTANPGATATPSPTASPVVTSTPTPTPTPTPNPASVTGTASIGSGSIFTAGPVGAGYSTEIDFPTTAPSSGTTATYTLSVNAPAQVPSPAPSCSPSGLGTPLVYLSFTVSQSVTTSAGPTEKLTLPASFSTSGHTFYQEFDDVTNPSHQCPDVASSVSGQTVTFAGGGKGTTLNAGDTFVIVFFYQP